MTWAISRNPLRPGALVTGWRRVPPAPGPRRGRPVRRVDGAPDLVRLEKHTARVCRVLWSPSDVAGGELRKPGAPPPASRSLFSVRFTCGSAIVRLSRSAAMSRRRSSAMPLSCASASATMCSMSVAAVPSARMLNARQEYGV